MTNARKAQGDRAEIIARNWARLAGFPHCERTRAGYTRDNGDLHLTAGIIAQVKDCRTLRWSEWLPELDAQIVQAHADTGFLIVKRPGLGAAQAGRWLAVKPFERELLDLRRAGYGTALEDTA